MRPRLIDLRRRSHGLPAARPSLAMGAETSLGPSVETVMVDGTILATRYDVFVQMMSTAVAQPAVVRVRRRTGEVRSLSADADGRLWARPQTAGRR